MTRVLDKKIRAQMATNGEIKKYSSTVGGALRQGYMMFSVKI